MAALKTIFNTGVTRNLPNGGGSYVTPAGPQYTPAGGYGTVDGNYTYGKNGWLNSTAITPAATVTPTVSTPAPVNTPSSKDINPVTGAYYTAKEYADNVARNLPISSVKDGGDVGKYAGDAITQPNKSTTDLQSTARNLNNSRNDIVTGNTDPYDITQGGTIVYSPEERTAIQKAYAGVYDPALNDVFTRLKEQKTKDDAAASAKQKREDTVFSTNESIRQWKATTGSKTSSEDELLSVTDAQNLGVPYGTTKSQAASMGIIPSDLSSSTKTMVEAAPTVKMFTDKISKEISDAQSGIGPIASRWREFKAGKIGLEDPAFTQLRTNISLLTTSLLKMHVGARGGDTMMAHFKELVDLGKQSPENLLAAISEISDYADFIESKGQTTQNSSSITADERAYLKSQGVSDAEINKLQ